MIRALNIMTAIFGSKKDDLGEIIAVNGDGTYQVRFRGKVLSNVGSISGNFYTVGQKVALMFSFGQWYLP